MGTNVKPHVHMGTLLCLSLLDQPVTESLLSGFDGALPVSVERIRWSRFIHAFSDTAGKGRASPDGLHRLDTWFHPQILF